MFAAVGSGDGMRLVVWGIGDDARGAYEEAVGYADLESGTTIDLVSVEITEEQRAQICAGEVDVEVLGLDAKALWSELQNRPRTFEAV